MAKKMYVFERTDGHRYVKQFATLEEAEAWATSSGDTKIR